MTMIEVKTAELIGSALDWAVAKAEGLGPILMPIGRNRYEIVAFYGHTPDGGLVSKCFRYSIDWAQGGPLIDRFKVGAVPTDVGLAAGSGSHWFATAFFNGKSYDNCHKGEGPTALVAACRAIVGLLLGDVVSVPAELVQGGGV